MENLKQIIAARIIRNAEKIGSKARTVKGSHKAIVGSEKNNFRYRAYIPHWSERRAGREEAKKDARIKREKKCTAVIPLGTDSENHVRSTVRSLYPRRKNWESPRPVQGNYAPYCNEIDNGNYSSRCTYKHWTYEPCVGCWAIIRGKLGLEFWYAGVKSMLQAPNGYFWKKDSNGIHIIDSTGKKDYHPTSDDLRSYSKAAIRQKAIDNYNTRKAIAAENRRKAKENADQKKHNMQLIRKAEKEGAMVCLKDSLRAGNCQAGTTNFANRHGLDVKKHYMPTSLLKIANGQADRVALAVAVGLRRHYSEMRQGFCEIENHVA